MAIVGRAEIKITPNTAGFGAALKRALDGVRGNAAGAGGAAGRAFGDDFFKGVENAFRANLPKFQGFGDELGRAISAGMDASLSRAVDDALSRNKDKFGSAGRDSGTAFTAGVGEGSKDVDRRLSDALNGPGPRVAASKGGKSSGSAFAAAFDSMTKKGFGASAIQSANQFAVQFAMLGAQGTMMTVLAGAASSAAAGLFLVGTAAASAAASGAGLIGVLGSLVQGGIAVGIAFKGVFSAIGAGMKAATSSVSGAAKQSESAGVASARRIADARARIGEVQTRNAQRLADASEKVRTAEQRLAAAQDRATAAQKRLTQARADAAEELQQLWFSVEDAALAERRAQISYAQAEDAARQARANLPEDSIDRKDAELALAEAELNLRQAKDRAQDLAAQQAKMGTAKTGDNGQLLWTEAQIQATDAYSSAQNDLIDAQNDAADATNALADAKKDQARTEQDAAAELARARLELARAQEDAAIAQREAASAQEGTNKALSDYNQKLNMLSPAAQAFVTYMVSMRERFNEFKKAVQEPFFENFNEPFKEMVGTLLPVAERGLSRTSGIMGTLVGQFSSALTNNVGAFGSALEFNNRILEKFSTTTSTGKSAVGNLVDAFFRLLEAIKPLTDRFANFLVHLTEVASKATDSKREMQSLTEFFNRAGDRMAKFGDIFSSIFSTIGTIAKAAGPAVDELMSYFDDAFNQIQGEAESSTKGIGEYFNGVVKNLKPLFDLLGQIAMVFIGLGDNKAIGETFTILQGAVEPLRQMAEAGASAGPALARLAVSVANVLAAFGKSDAMSVLFDTFAKMGDMLATALNSGIGQSLLITLAPILAVFKALSLAAMGLQFVGTIAFGSLLKFIQPIIPVLQMLMGNFGAVVGVVSKLRAVFALLTGPVGIIIGIFTVLIPLFVNLYKNNEDFRDSINRMISTFMEFGVLLWNTIKPVFDILAQAFKDVWKAVQPLIVEVAEKAIPIFTKWYGMLFSLLIPVIKLLVNVIKLLAEAVVWYLTNVILPVFSSVFKVILGILDFFVSGITRAFNWVLEAWNKYGKPALEIVTNAFDALRRAIVGENSIFSRLVDGIRGVFSSLWGVVKRPLNALIENINKYMIDNLNKVVKPFGVTIDHIQTFADGGPVTGPGGPRDDKVLSRLSNGEFVVKAASVRRYGQSFMHSVNDGTFPTGGFGDWIASGIDGLKNLASGILDVIKEGPAAAIKYIYNKTIEPFVSNLSKDPNMLMRLVGGVLRAFASKLTDWGADKQKKQDAAAGSGTSVPKYDGPPGGWTYPLTKRFPGRNWEGHRPYWAVDIAAPTGTGVLAASAGVVTLVRDRGNTSYGKFIKIAHAGGRQTLYAHLQAFRTHTGAIVNTGQLIGISNNSGGSRGPHLHFELLPGSDTIAGMRALGVRLATGGVVRATPGGVMAMLAEGGRHERVEPLDSSGLSTRDRALIDAVARAVAQASGASSGNGITVKVYLGDQELRSMVRYEISDSQSALARELRIGRRR